MREKRSDTAKESGARTVSVGIAPFAHLPANLVANPIGTFTGRLAPGVQGLPPDLTELPRLFPGSFPGFSGCLPCLIAPPPESIWIPKTSCAARHGDQNNRNQAEEQEFHGVIDEGNPDLFRKVC